MTYTIKAGKHKSKYQWKLLLLTLPFLIFIILFNYVPLLGWVISFFDYKVGRGLSMDRFVGLKYFKSVFTDPDILNSLKNTLIFSGLNYILYPVPMVMAILLGEISRKWFRKTAQIVTTIPHFIGWVIVYSLAYALFSTEGLYNQTMISLGIDKSTSVLTDVDAVYIFQVIVAQWKHLGWSAIIFIAAMTGIDQELYEAAEIDGAGRFKRIMHITVPLLMPTLITLMIIGIGNFINTGYEQYLAFKNPIVSEKIEVLDLYIYRMGLQLGDYSYATVVGIIKSLISIAMVFGVNALAKKVRGSSVL